MELFSHSLSLLERAVEAGETPSAAVAIGLRGRLLTKAVYGNSRTVGGRALADLSTRYDMASLTKILSTTMTAFRMMEEGLLHLYDTVGDFFPAASPQAEITLFQLMTHTGGLPPHIMLSDFTTEPEKAPQVILSAELVCSPGTQVHYSCMGYILLGEILEQLGGAPLDRLAQRYVFDPLEMTHTGYLPQGDNFAATEITPEGECLCGVVHDENARFLGGVSGNAGLFSDLADSAAFASMLACCGVFKGSPFLSPALFSMAIQNATLGLSQNRGLGFHLKGAGSFHGDLFSNASFGHTGFTGTSLLIDPVTGLYVALLANRVHPSRENTAFLRFRRLFHNAVMAEFSRSSLFEEGRRRL